MIHNKTTHTPWSWEDKDSCCLKYLSVSDLEISKSIEILLYKYIVYPKPPTRASKIAPWQIGLFLLLHILFSVQHVAWVRIHSEWPLTSIHPCRKSSKHFYIWMPLTEFMMTQADVETTNMAASLSFKIVRARHVVWSGFSLGHVATWTNVDLEDRPRGPSWQEVEPFLIPHLSSSEEPENSGLQIGEVLARLWKCAKETPAMIKFHRTRRRLLHTGKWKLKVDKKYLSQPTKSISPRAADKYRAKSSYPHR